MPETVSRDESPAEKEARLVAKSAKELAYLHDLYVATDWSERFAELIDKSLVVLPKDGQFLYAECGTGGHAMELREKLKDTVQFYATESDPERLKIAESKAQIVAAPVHFQNSFPHKLNFPAATFGNIICDGSFLPVERLRAVWQELFRVLESKGSVGFVLPTAGSFGDFFSTFWEALYTLELKEMGAQVEDLIKALPTVSDVEDTARNAGFAHVESATNIELFEFATGNDFVRSPLVSDFLYPLWTGFIPDAQQVRVLRQIEKVIDDARDDLSFRLTVKMTLVTAKKA